MVPGKCPNFIGLFDTVAGIAVGLKICETFQHFLESEVYRRLSQRMLGNLRNSRYPLQDRQEKIR
jgi:hypothetical protein